MTRGVLLPKPIQSHPEEQENATKMAMAVARQPGGLDTLIITITNTNIIAQQPNFI